MKLLALLALVPLAAAIARAERHRNARLAVLGQVTPKSSTVIAGRPLVVSIALQNYSSSEQYVRYFPPQTMVQLCVWKKNGNFERPHKREGGYSGHTNAFTVNLSPGQTWLLQWTTGSGEVSSFDTRIWGYRFDHPGAFALSAVYAGLVDGDRSSLCPGHAPQNATRVTVKPRPNDDDPL